MRPPLSAVVSDDDSMSAGAIAGIAIGSAAGAALLVVLVVMLFLKRNKNSDPPMSGLKSDTRASDPSVRASVQGQGGW